MRPSIFSFPSYYFSCRFLQRLVECRGRCSHGGCAFLGAHSRHLAALDILIPKIVMLLCPDVIDVAGAHGLLSALLAHRSHVDMAYRCGDDQYRADHMDHVRDLHVRARAVDAGHQIIEHEAGGADYQPEHGDAAPEPQFFSGIETAGMRMLLSEHSTHRKQPFEIAGARKIILDEDD